MALVVKNLPPNAGTIRDTGSIPGSGRPPRGGYGNPLQYSCLENPCGQRNLVGYSPYSCKQLDWTEANLAHMHMYNTPPGISLSSLKGNGVWRPEAGSHHPKLPVTRPSTDLLLSLSSVLCKQRGGKNPALFQHSSKKGDSV